MLKIPILFIHILVFLCIIVTTNQKNMILGEIDILQHNNLHFQSFNCERKDFTLLWLSHTLVYIYITISLTSHQLMYIWLDSIS